MAIHRILREAFGDTLADSPEARAERASGLEWNALSAEWYPRMLQPPYGDRAIALRDTGELVGAVGLVPMLMPFDQIPELARRPAPHDPARVSAEVGLFWAIDPLMQRRGFATEAALSLIEYAFNRLRLWRIVATTEYENHASQAVMLKAGMTLTRNPRPEPPWMQVVGVRYASPQLADIIEPPGLLT